MKRRIAFLMLLLVGSVSALAQTSGTIQAVKLVNLRTGPSSKNKLIRQVTSGESLDLVAVKKKNNYFHVRTATGEAGWVWARNVGPLISNSAELIESAATTETEATINSTWPKATPHQSTFNGAEGPCIAKGDGSDPDQFILKNRDDAASPYHDVTWTAIDNLPFPGKDNKNERAKNLRKRWSNDQLAIIQPYEGIPVRTVGYIVAIKPQNGGAGEGTNCHQNQNGDVDAHLAFVNHLGDPESQAIVIEWTPRILTSHPNWTKAKLSKYASKPIRISGWLMVDPDHYGHLGRYRNTIWEIHPITDIEVTTSGGFISLDDAP